MIGDMIAKARVEKNMTKAELARLANIDLGHLSHIEKGERNPSHKTLKLICQALEIPYQQLMYTYDKNLSEEQESYGALDHMSYDKIILVDTIDNFITCPANMPGASLAVKMPDDSMAPTFKKGDTLFIEFNTLLDNKEVGIFSVDDKIYIRRFIGKKNKVILDADNPHVKKLELAKNQPFFIIGKILNK